jgi:hypothetical protein
VALVPLDDRPCNRLFPQQLADVSGWQLLMPPRELLGWFTSPGQCDAIGEWLRACACDRVAVALDMVCFGGLVASRLPTTGPEVARQRLQVLRDLRRERPKCIIFAFSSIMRLGTTVDSPEALALHQALLAYSQLIDRVERLGDEEARPALERAISDLDPQVLGTYLEVRERNHTINQAAIRLAAEGVLDYLVLAQEDAAPVGLHIPEQLALRALVEEFRLADRVAMHPGGDEVGLVLLARHHLEAAGQRFAIATEYATAQGAAVVPVFEHQPLAATVESQIRAAGARLSAAEEADALLLVHTPLGVQRDIAEAPDVGDPPALAAQAARVVERVAAAARHGRLVGLADVAYSNGADPELIAALKLAGGADHPWPGRLAAFAGWNTAANAIGTVIAHLSLAAAGGGRLQACEASTEFLACRLADDYGYQSCVRKQAVEEAARLGANPYALGKAWPTLEAFVEARLKPLAHQLHSDLLGRRADAVPAGELRVSLPWGRLFEVEVEFSSPAAKNRR